MTECSKVFRNLGESYGQLYRTSFNADPVSLKNIETYLFTWFFVAQFDHDSVTHKVFSNEYHCCVSNNYRCIWFHVHLEPFRLFCHWSSPRLFVSCTFSLLNEVHLKAILVTDGSQRDKRLPWRSWSWNLEDSPEISWFFYEVATWNIWKSYMYTAVKKWDRSDPRNIITSSQLAC